jgi:hypothetical protein
VGCVGDGGIWPEGLGSAVGRRLPWLMSAILGVTPRLRSQIPATVQSLDGLMANGSHPSGAMVGTFSTF